jgi:hypothetical protein
MGDADDDVGLPTRDLPGEQGPVPPGCAGAETDDRIRCRQVATHLKCCSDGINEAVAEVVIPAWGPEVCRRRHEEFGYEDIPPERATP